MKSTGKEKPGMTSRVMAPGCSQIRISTALPGTTGVVFLAAYPAPGETGDPCILGYEEKAGCASHGTACAWSSARHSSCQPWLPGLPALPSIIPVSLGTALLDTLLFPVRQPMYWGIWYLLMVILKILAKEEFNSTRGHLQFYTLTTQTFLHSFFHFSYIRKLRPMYFLCSSWSCL